MLKTAYPARVLLIGGLFKHRLFFFRYYSHYNGDILKFHDLLYEWVFSGRVAHNPTSEVGKQKTEPPPPPSWRWEPPLQFGVRKSSTPAPKFCFLLRTHVGGTEDALKVFPPPVPQSTVPGSCRLPVLRRLTVQSFSMASHHPHNHTGVSASATTSCMERTPVAVSSATGLVCPCQPPSSAWWLP